MREIGYAIVFRVATHPFTALDPQEYLKLMASINSITLLFSIQPYLLFSLFAFSVVDVVVVCCDVVKVVIAVDDTGVVVESFVVAVPIKSFLSYMLKIAAALGTLI